MVQLRPSSVALALAGCVTACTTADRSDLLDLPGDAQAVSLLGDTLYPPTAPPEVRARQEAELAAARAAYDHTPDNADSIIWLGRRLAYRGGYRDAIPTYTRGITLHPADARLYRHRGHRFITLREFDLAIADLARAARLVAGRPDEIEPDGQPNRLGIPLSTLQFNIWYHLGLAHYLKGDFLRAASAYRQCLEVSTNPDLLVATSYWLYLTLSRLGEKQEAAELLRPIHAGMVMVENDTYHRLLLMYRGEIAPDSVWAAAQGEGALELATAGYGVGAWHLLNGDRERAEAIFRQVLAAPQWAAFGYIAAEAEIARRRGAGGGDGTGGSG